MAFTVEDGTGLANANAFISVAFANAYFADTGNTVWDAYTDTVCEQAIVRATAYLSNAFSWKGTPVLPRVQALAWPRTGVKDGEGYDVPVSPIPIEIRRACAEIALREAATPGVMTPDVTLSAAVKREKIGPMEVEYLNQNTGADASRPVLLAVSALISGFLAENTAGAGAFFSRSYLV
jgi:hypothetical protein